MGEKRKVWLEWVRGLLWGVLGLELVVASILIQSTIQQYLESVVSVPTEVLPLLTFFQATVVLSLAAAALLFAGMVIRLTGD